MKQRELSRWLKAITIILAVCTILACVYIVPSQGKLAAARVPEYAKIYLPALIFVEVTFIPVFVSLILVWQIFSDIGRDNSFSRKNAARLRVISRLALFDTLLYLLVAVLIIIVNALTPGIILLLLAVLFIGTCSTVASAAFSHLTYKAAALKDESDLTI